MYAIRSYYVFIQYTALSDKTFRNQRGIGNFRTGTYNKVIHDHSFADMYRSFRITVDASIHQFFSAIDQGIPAKFNIQDGRRI